MTTATRNPQASKPKWRPKYYQQSETRRKTGKNMVGNGSYSSRKICNFHGIWHQSSNIFFRVHRSRQNLHRGDLEKAFEVVNALAKYKPQIRLTTNGTNHTKELLRNTQIFNEPIWKITGNGCRKKPYRAELKIPLWKRCAPDFCTFVAVCGVSKKWGERNDVCQFS